MTSWTIYRRDFHDVYIYIYIVYIIDMQICNKPSELLLIRVLVPRGLLLHYIPPPLWTLCTIRTFYYIIWMPPTFLATSCYGLFVVIFGYLYYSEI